MVRKAPTLTKRRESDAEPGRSPSEFDDSGIGLEARPRGTPAPSTTGPPLAYIYSSVLVALLALVVYPRLAKIAELDGALVRLQGQYDDLQQRVASTATTTADMISQQNLLLKVRQLELQINDRLLGLETRMEQLKTRVGNDERTGFQDLNAAPDADQLHEALHRLERDQQSAVQNLQQQLQLLASRYGPHSNLTETLEKRYGRCEERLRRLETSLIQNQTGIITVQTSDAVDVRRIVNRLLYRHMADGTERVDYALESVGGKVLASSGVHHANGWSQIAHLLTLTPSTYAMGHIIRPSMQLSDCWPMPGSSGWIVLELSASILVDAVTVEHVAPETAPQFRYRTAWRRGRLPLQAEAVGVQHGSQAIPGGSPLRGSVRGDWHGRVSTSSTRGGPRPGADFRHGPSALLQPPRQRHDREQSWRFRLHVPLSVSCPWTTPNQYSRRRAGVIGRSPRDSILVAAQGPVSESQPVVKSNGLEARAPFRKRIDSDG